MEQLFQKFSENIYSLLKSSIQIYVLIHNSVLNNQHLKKTQYFKS